MPVRLAFGTQMVDPDAPSERLPNRAVATILPR